MMIRRQKDRDRIPLINEEWGTFPLKEKDKIVSFKDDIIIVSIEILLNSASMYKL